MSTNELKITTNNFKVIKSSTNKKFLDEIVTKLDKSNFPSLDISNGSNKIILSEGNRTPSSTLCNGLKKGCSENGTHHRIPKSKRRLLATNFDLFIAGKARSCSVHNKFDEYDPSKAKKYNRFTVPQFEKFVDDIKQGLVVIDFDDIEAMPDHICEYWTGLRVSQFLKMYDGLKQPKARKSALAVYLIRQITGDSVQKLAKLLNLSSYNLKRQLRSVENHFSKKAMNKM